MTRSRALSNAAAPNARGQAQTFRAPPRRRPPFPRCCLSVLEIVTFVEILDEAGTRRVPAEQLLGQRARRGVVKRDGPGEIFEVGGDIVWRDADGWQIQVAADGL